KANGEVDWLKSPVTANGKTYPAGTYFIGASSLPVVQKAAADLGVNFVGTTARPADGIRLSANRIALVDRYGGSLPSGWTRLGVENFEIPYTTVFRAEVNAGNLKRKYDVIVFPSDMSIGGGGRGGGGGGGGRAGGEIPAEYQKMLG